MYFMKDSPNKNKKVFLTTAQAAEILNVSQATLKKFVYQRKLKAFKTPGGHYRILKRDLFGLVDG